MTREALDAPAIFVSDVHLKQGDAKELDLFLAFLRGPARSARQLVIHGDLFEFYVGPRQGRDPWWAPLQEALRELAQAGTKITLLHGNRDYQIESDFAQGSVRVLSGDWHCLAGEQRLRVSHGDEMCIHDWSYQVFGRGLLRTALVRWLVRSLPFCISRLLATSYRGVSKARRRGKSYSRLGSILDGAKQHAEGQDVLIAGHIHELARTELFPGRGAVLWTTGAWEDGPNYIHWDGVEFRAIRL
jgi:UDP-2,3-diacylglucosamine hydrolase